MIASLFIVLLSGDLEVTFGFGSFASRQHLPIRHVSSTPSIPTQLEAKGAGGGKKKKKKKTISGGTGGGFGKTAVAEEAIDIDDDYSAFPALEPNVKETLVSSTPEMRHETGELNGEMYDRLAQIYGFDWFNYREGEDPSLSDDDASGDSSEIKSEPSMSFDELLSGGGGESTSIGSSSSSSSGFGDLLGASKASASSSDFSDLIAEASGGTSGGGLSGMKSNAAASAPVGKLDLPALAPFNDFRILNVDPMVLAIDDFFTEDECDKYIEFALKPDLSEGNAPTIEVQSKTVGRNARDRAQRTSTTWFNHYKNVPELMAKASRLLGLTGIDRWEEPQIVRYRKGEKFTWHLDALAPDGELASLGGQRIATLLVYLTDLSEDQGGTTMFRDLGGEDGPLKVTPKKGSALLFFPAAGGIDNSPFDIRTLHCGEAVKEDSKADKWISQLWLRETSYKPTAPPDNSHAAAAAAINKYCNA